MVERTINANIGKFLDISRIADMDDPRMERYLTGFIAASVSSLLFALGGARIRGIHGLDVPPHGAYFERFTIKRSACLSLPAGYGGMGIANRTPACGNEGNIKPKRAKGVTPASLHTLRDTPVSSVRAFASSKLENLFFT